MAYFANGSEGDYYERKYCRRCVHWANSICPVMDLHMEWNYEAAGKDADKTKHTALNTLWPTKGGHNSKCAMFHAQETLGEK